MKNKAFIFDMDGVLVDSERAWGDDERTLLEDMFGKKIAEKVGDTVGFSIQKTYAKARDLGAAIPYETYIKRYHAAALKVLDRAKLTKGIDVLGKKLVELGYKLALVSSSPEIWIDRIVPRLPFKNDLAYVESLFEHPELRPKPYPDGYIEAMRRLKTDAKQTIILEDSNPGIEAAKASGAFVIGFRGNLIKGYEQRGADAYADTMGEVQRIVCRL